MGFITYFYKDYIFGLVRSLGPRVVLAVLMFFNLTKEVGMSHAAPLGAVNRRTLLCGIVRELNALR